MSGRLDCTLSLYPTVATMDTTMAIMVSCVVRLHDLVAADVAGEVARDALLPAGDLEGRGVAPGLEGELGLDGVGEVLRPAIARKGGGGALDELRVDEVGAAEVQMSSS